MQWILYVVVGISFVNLMVLIALLFKKRGGNANKILFLLEELKLQTKEKEASTQREFKLNREELGKQMFQFSSFFREEQTRLIKENRHLLGEVATTVEKQLSALQRDNAEKLEKMRETVDEKLHKTLETRLGESFKLVSERLEEVQRGLGEMKTLATGVGDLKKVLSNVKTKGVLGEYQLEALLDELLTPAQYEKNVKTKQGSKANVEFAIKIPSKANSGESIYLPIDSKFPTEDYERLLAAYEIVNPVEIDIQQKELKRKIIKFAQDIKEKYIDVPNTTEFGILFLPFEGLYAEVLRIPGLFEQIQREHKITITGPTTLSAFISSLQMGFRTLAVEKRTQEIWAVLGAVRTEFGKLGTIIEKTRDKIDSASKELDGIGVRSRKIEGHLRNVEALPERESEKLLR